MCVTAQEYYQGWDNQYDFILQGNDITLKFNLCSDLPNSLHLILGYLHYFCNTFCYKLLYVSWISSLYECSFSSEWYRHLILLIWHNIASLTDYWNNDTFDRHLSVYIP